MQKLKAAEEERDMLRHEVDSLYQVTAPILNREYRTNPPKQMDDPNGSPRSPWQSSSKRADLLVDRGRKPPTYGKPSGHLTLSEKKVHPNKIMSQGISPTAAPHLKVIRSLSKN